MQRASNYKNTFQQIGQLAAAYCMWWAWGVASLSIVPPLKVHEPVAPYIYGSSHVGQRLLSWPVLSPRGRMSVLVLALTKEFKFFLVSTK